MGGLAALVLASTACSGVPTATPTAVPTATPTPFATATAQPTSTPVPTATATPAPTPTQVVVSYLCRNSGQSSLVDLAVGTGQKNSITVDAASGIETIFGSYYADPAHRSNFVCRNVVRDGNYLIVVANDGKTTNYPPSMAHVFKIDHDTSGTSRLGYVGYIPNMGHQADNSDRIAIVPDDNGSDILIMADIINIGEAVNDAMFNAYVPNKSGIPTNYLAALRVFRLDGKPTPINPAGFGGNQITLIAARPYFPKMGANPQIDLIYPVDPSGTRGIIFKVSEDVMGVPDLQRNPGIGSGYVKLDGPDGLLNGGINTEPLKVR